MKRETELGHIQPGGPRGNVLPSKVVCHSYRDGKLINIYIDNMRYCQVIDKFS